MHYLVLQVGVPRCLCSGERIEQNTVLRGLLGPGAWEGGSCLDIRAPPPPGTGIGIRRVASRGRVGSRGSRGFASLVMHGCGFELAVRHPAVSVVSLAAIPLTSLTFGKV